MRYGRVTHCPGTRTPLPPLPRARFRSARKINREKGKIMSAPAKGAAKDGSSLAETVARNLEKQGLSGATGASR